MEATVFVCVVTAIACALLTLDGAGKKKTTLRRTLPLHRSRSRCVFMLVYLYGADTVCCVLHDRIAACLVNVESACVLDRASNIVMVIIGSVTLVPVGAALFTAWLDHRTGRRGEYSRLL